MEWFVLSTHVTWLVLHPSITVGFPAAVRHA